MGMEKRFNIYTLVRYTHLLLRQTRGCQLLDSLLEHVNRDKGVQLNSLVAVTQPLSAS